MGTKEGRGEDGLGRSFDQLGRSRSEIGVVQKDKRRSVAVEEPARSCRRVIGRCREVEIKDDRAHHLLSPSPLFLPFDQPF